MPRIGGTDVLSDGTRAVILSLLLVLSATVAGVGGSVGTAAAASTSTVASISADNIDGNDADGDSHYRDFDIDINADTNGVGSNDGDGTGGTFSPDSDKPYFKIYLDGTLVKTTDHVSTSDGTFSVSLASSDLSSLSRGSVTVKVELWDADGAWYDSTNDLVYSHTTYGVIDYETAGQDTPQYTLTVNAASNGGFTIDRASYSSTTSKSFDKDSTVSVSANPDAGYQFDHWTGDYPSGHRTDSTLSVSMDSSKELTPVFSKANPDLEVVDIEWKPANPVEGSDVEFSITIKNTGEATADTIETRGTVDGELVAVPPVVSLGPGESEQLTYTGNSEFPAGTHTITATVDPDDHIEESDESNNDRQESFSVEAKYGTVTGRVTDTDGNPISNAKVYLDSTEDTRTNDQGYYTFQNVPAGPHTVDVGITGYEAPSERSISVEAGETETVDFSLTPETHTVQLTSEPIEASLSGGGTYDYGDSLTISAPASVGDYEFQAWKTHSGELVSNKRTFQVDYITREYDIVAHYARPGAPDLEIQSITPNVSNPSEGQPVSFDVVIKNTGNARAADLDTELNAGSNIYRLTDADLEPGAQMTLRFGPWTAETGVSTVSAEIDYNNAISESDETNNEHTSDLSVADRQPNLVVTSITPSPERPSEGDRVTFDVTIANRGPVATSDFGLRLNAGGETYSHTGLALDAGETRTFTLGPWTATEDTESITATVDFRDTVTESDEGDNTLTTNPLPSVGIEASRTSTVVGSPISLRATVPDAITVQSYKWTVTDIPAGDGDVPATPRFQTQRVTPFRPDAAGTYSLALTVTTTSGDEFTAFKTITVEPRSPLIERFAPVVHFHQDEQYFPTRYEAYVRNSVLTGDGASISNPVLWDLKTAPPGSTLPLPGDQSAYSTYDNAYPPTIYASVHDGVQFKGETYTAVTYWLFYVYDPKGGDIASIAAHRSDTETITVLVQDGTARWLAASQHYGGERREWEKVKRTGSHPHIYPAKGAHSNYLRNTSAYDGDGLLIQDQFIDDDSQDTSSIIGSPPITDVTGGATEWTQDGSRGTDYELSVLTGNEPWMDFPGTFTDDSGRTPRQRTRWQSPGTWARFLPTDEAQLDARVQSVTPNADGTVNVTIENVGPKPHQFYVTIEAKPSDSSWTSDDVRTVTDVRVPIGVDVQRAVQTRTALLPDTLDKSWHVRTNVTAYPADLAEPEDRLATATISTNSDRDSPSISWRKKPPQNTSRGNSFAVSVEGYADAAGSVCLYSYPGRGPYADTPMRSRCRDVTKGPYQFTFTYDSPAAATYEDTNNFTFERYNNIRFQGKVRTTAGLDVDKERTTSTQLQITRSSVTPSQFPFEQTVRVRVPSADPGYQNYRWVNIRVDRNTLPGENRYQVEISVENVGKNPEAIAPIAGLTEELDGHPNSRIFVFRDTNRTQIESVSSTANGQTKTAETAGDLAELWRTVSLANAAKSGLTAIFKEIITKARNKLAYEFIKDVTQLGAAGGYTVPAGFQDTGENSTERLTVDFETDQTSPFNLYPTTISNVQNYTLVLNVTATSPDAALVVLYDMRGKFRHQTGGAGSTPDHRYLAEYRRQFTIDLPASSTNADSTAPTITSVTPGESDAVTPTALVEASFTDTGSGVDPSSVSVTVDGDKLPLNKTTRTDATGRLGDLELAPGTHQLTITVADHAGNQATVERSFTVDSKKPTVAIDVNATTVSPTDPMAVTTSVSDRSLASATIRIRNATTGSTVRTWQTSRGTQTVVWSGTTSDGRLASGGTYVLELTAEDELGRTATTQREVTLETEPPTISIDRVTGDDRSAAAFAGAVLHANESITVTGTTTAGSSPIDTVTVTLSASFTNFEHTASATVADDGTWSATVDLSGLPDDGTYLVSATAIGSRGLTNRQTGTTTVALDRDAPTVTARLIPKQGALNTLVVTSDEPLAGVPSLKVDQPNGPAKSVSLSKAGSTRWTGTFPMGQPGTYKLSVSGMDAAGNVDTARVTTAVKTSFSPGPDGSVTVGGARTDSFITLHLGDANSLGDSEYAALNALQNSPVTLAPDQHGAGFLDGELSTTLSDAMENATIAIPVNESRIPSGETASSLSIHYYNDTTDSWEALDTSVETRTVPGGSQEREYWVTNVTHFSVYGVVSSDTTPPMLESASPSGTVTGSAQTVVFDYTDTVSSVNASQITLSVDGTPVTSTDPATVTSDRATYDATDLSSGEHTASVTVADTAGNTATFSTTFTVEQIDASAPAVTFDTPTAGATFPSGTDSITVSARYSDANSNINTSSVRLLVDGIEVTESAALTEDHITYDVSGLESGAHTATVVVSDTSGNTQQSQVSFEITAPPLSVDATTGTGSTTVTAGTPVTLSATNVTGTTSTATFEWDIGGDGSVEATGRSIQYAFNETGDREVILRVTDGSRETITSLLVTVSAETDDGGAGGGEGGGSSIEPPKSDGVVTDTSAGATVAVKSPHPDEPVRVLLPEFPGTPVGFSQLSIEFTEQAPDFELAIQPEQSPQSSAPAPPGPKTIGFFRVKTDVDDGVIDQATFLLSIPEDALPADATMGDVQVYRYHEGTWTAVQTNAYAGGVEVKTPGFSVFAIGLKAPETTTQSATPSTATTTPTTTSQSTTESPAGTSSTRAPTSGFGMSLALLALLVTALLTRRPD